MPATPTRILIATDFSPAAERAQQLAERLAGWFSAELHLVHVRVLLEDPHLAAEDRIEVQRLLSTTDSRKEAALRTTAAGGTVQADPHLVRGLSASEAIVETGADLGCDLLVTGTHGRRGFKHLLIGSVAEEVVRTADVPVLTVREDTQVPADGISSVLVSHDFSEHSAEAVRTAGAWARALGARVTLMHVVEPVVYPEFYAIDVMPHNAVNEIHERARRALAETAVELLGDVPHEVRVVRGRAADEIVASAGDHHQLVVMGTRGLSALEHLLLGSVAESVLRRCPAPLLAVKP